MKEIIELIPRLHLQIKTVSPFDLEKLDFVSLVDEIKRLAPTTWAIFEIMTVPKQGPLRYKRTRGIDEDSGEEGDGVEGEAGEDQGEEGEEEEGEEGEEGEEEEEDDEWETVEGERRRGRKRPIERVPRKRKDRGMMMGVAVALLAYIKSNRSNRLQG